MGCGFVLGPDVPARNAANSCSEFTTCMVIESFDPAEGYRPRSTDVLRPYLALIEKFILDKAGVMFDPAPGGLRVVIQQ